MEVFSMSTLYRAELIKETVLYVYIRAHISDQLKTTHYQSWPSS